eukprot:gb/GEZN01021524.1/.p1 GENE.gb/GEZN01021524.1/~~gb/GEZN01021524.1/.p1  ORF type:complete len:117 (-),score=6.24 gb/GEZN01021524.1/:264-614(-)
MVFQGEKSYRSFSKNSMALQIAPFYMAHLIPPLRQEYAGFVLPGSGKVGIVDEECVVCLEDLGGPDVNAKSLGAKMYPCNCMAICLACFKGMQNIDQRVCHRCQRIVASYMSVVLR